jgi:hypothetical protein
MPLKLDLSSKKLILSLVGLVVIFGEAFIDAVLGLPHADLLVKSTVTLALGGIGTQGTIDVIKEFLSNVGKVAK